MLVNFPDTIPVKLATGLNDIKLHISVLGGTTNVLYLAHTREELSPIGGTVTGFPVSQTDGPVELQWTGDVWAMMSTAPNQIIFTIESAGNVRIGKRHPVIQSGVDTSSGGNAAASPSGTGGHKAINHTLSPNLPPH